MDVGEKTSIKVPSRMEKAQEWHDDGATRRMREIESTREKRGGGE